MRSLPSDELRSRFRIAVIRAQSQAALWCRIGPRFPREFTAADSSRVASAVDLIGRTLSHYRINAAIGAGGRGEVYNATDTKLDRDVALNVAAE